MIRGAHLFSACCVLVLVGCGILIQLGEILPGGSHALNLEVIKRMKDFVDRYRGSEVSGDDETSPAP